MDEDFRGVSCRGGVFSSAFPECARVDLKGALGNSDSIHKAADLGVFGDNQQRGRVVCDVCFDGIE